MGVKYSSRIDIGKGRGCIKLYGAPVLGHASETAKNSKEKRPTKKTATY